MNRDDCFCKRILNGTVRPPMCAVFVLLKKCCRVLSLIIPRDVMEQVGYFYNTDFIL